MTKASAANVVLAYLESASVGVDAAAAQRISLQEARDRGLFGPVWHGTPQESLKNIREEGFKVFETGPSEGPTVHGYPDRPYHGGIPAPVHHLGYGVYFTTSKSNAKHFAGGTARGMRTYYLDVPRLETINFGAPRTMMGWWVDNGYDPELARTDRVEATRRLTQGLKSKYDAVWFKGKGIRRLLDGDQVVVFDPSRIYEIDPGASKPGDIGSKVRRKSDGMVGVLKNVRPLPEDFRQFHGGAERFLEVKWKKGGTDFNVYDRDVEFI